MSTENNNPIDGDAADSQSQTDAAAPDVTNAVTNAATTNAVTADVTAAATDSATAAPTGAASSNPASAESSGAGSAPATAASKVPTRRPLRPFRRQGGKLRDDDDDGRGCGGYFDSGASRPVRQDRRPSRRLGLRGQCSAHRAGRRHRLRFNSEGIVIRKITRTASWRQALRRSEVLIRAWRLRGRAHLSRADAGRMRAWTAGAAYRDNTP